MGYYLPLIFNGDQSATPSDQYIQWDITFHLSSIRIKSAIPSDGDDHWDIAFHLSSMGSNPPPPLTDTLNAIFLSTYLQEGSKPPPPLTDMFNGILPSNYLQWDQIRHPLWPIHPMNYYFPLLLQRNQIRHPLWLINGILPSTYLQEWSNPTPPDGYVLLDITFHLSARGIKSATPFRRICSMGYYLPHSMGSNPPLPLTDTFNGILPTTDLQWDQICHPLWPMCPMGNCFPLLSQGSNPPPPLTDTLNVILPSTYLSMGQWGSNPPPPVTSAFNGMGYYLALVVKSDQIRHPLCSKTRRASRFMLLHFHPAFLSTNVAVAFCSWSIWVKVSLELAIRLILLPGLCNRLPSSFHPGL